MLFRSCPCPAWPAVPVSPFSPHSTRGSGCTSPWTGACAVRFLYRPYSILLSLVLSYFDYSMSGREKKVGVAGDKSSQKSIACNVFFGKNSLFFRCIEKNRPKIKLSDNLFSRCIEKNGCQIFPFSVHFGSFWGGAKIKIGVNPPL